MSDLAGVLRADGDQVGVRFERDYATSPDDLWAAITEQERVARWLDRVTGDLRPGGSVTVHFDDGDGAFEIVRCEPKSVLEVRWLHDEGSTVVRAEVGAGESGGSRLVLEHLALTAAQAPGYAAGWHWHLRALAAVLAGREPESWDSFDALHEQYQGLRDQLATRS
jgi:uncharacterized protein YndB with AHSA1/START domain